MGGIKNKINIFLNTFAEKEVLKVAVTLFRGVIIFFKKFLAALEIIYYILIYYVKRLFNYLRYDLINDDVLYLELKSFFFVVFFSFFFYYFIVVELSILVFGYSLLCYRFLFILILACLLASWWLEVEYLKNELNTKSGVPYHFYLWIKFYNYDNPLSFYDFITNYKNRPFFKVLFLNDWKTELEEGRLFLSTISYLLIFFFIYSCSYKFDPWFINFVVKYFKPQVDFFETRSNPRSEDFISAPVWFWNWLVNYIEYTYKTHTEVYNIFKTYSEASPRIEDRANVQRSYKVSLWKRNQFGDIFFLRYLSLQPHVWKIVFEGDFPQISATRLDPNWKLFFFRYIKQSINAPTNNFWKKYFFNDNTFWLMLKKFKNDINTNSTRANKLAVLNYQSEETFITNIYETIISQNYFKQSYFNSTPLFQYYGTNRDFADIILSNYWIKKFYSDTPIKEFFSVTPLHSSSFNLTGLYTYQSKFKNQKLPIFSINNYKISKSQFMSFYDKIKNLNFLSDVNTFLSSDLTTNLYSFYTFENFENVPLAQIPRLFIRPINNKQLEKIYMKYNYRLTAIEKYLGIRERPFTSPITDDFNLALIGSYIEWRINRINSALQLWGFGSYLEYLSPTTEDFKYWIWKTFKLENFIQRKSIKDTFRPIIQKQEKKQEKKQEEKKFYIKFSAIEVEKFSEIESKLREIENKLLLRNSDTSLLPQLNLNNLKNKDVRFPWYIFSLKYFSTNTYNFILPGFVRYYSPTPFSFSFSTFGTLWNKYLFYQTNEPSTIVGYSDSISTIWNSTPVALYSGVEAVLYFKPLLDLFEYFIKLIIKFLQFFIEKIINFEIFTPLTSIASLVFFAHFVWFIHFYIYFFIFAYLFYYFLIYYFRKVGYYWFYEWSYQEMYLSQYNNRNFWFSIQDLWSNYKTPEQFFIFALHTNILTHFSFINLTNYFYVNNYHSSSIINLFLKLLPTSKFYQDYTDFSKWITFSEYKKSFRDDFYIFQAFFNARVWKFQILLFEGGADVSLNHLAWGYFEYLNQTSLFLTWSLWKNYYNIYSNNKLNFFIKTFTILISSHSVDKSYGFSSSPIFDTVLSRKSLLNLLDVIFKNFNYKNSNFYLNKSDVPFLQNIMLLSYWFDFYNFFIISGLDIFSLLKNNNLFFNNKLNSTSFWDDKKYWLLCFFRSFWFVSKFWYPYSNINLIYEDSRIHLARLAYCNSWILQSTFVRPHFNIIQHIWWTSKNYYKASSLISFSFNLNSPGINRIENVRNFLEKWFSFINNHKVETIFGLVVTHNLTSPKINIYNDESAGEMPPENRNFDLSFPDNLINKQTTSRGYLKTNPPLDLYSIGITPYRLFLFLRNLPPIFMKFYFTFINQLSNFDNWFNLIHWDLNKEFDKFDLYRITEGDYIDSIYDKYEFYFKKFDYLLKFDSNTPLNNYVFTFDISFFFNHFITFDYFTQSLSDKRSNNFFPKKFSNFAETNNLFLANQDLISRHDSYTYFHEKPMGILDWFELNVMHRYKLVKWLDENSFSWYWDDPFVNLDSEHTISNVGLAFYPKQDEKNLADTYLEEFSGARDKRFPYNPTIVKNKVGPFCLGWVGELLVSTNETLSLLYSLMYISSEPDVSSWSNDLHSLEKNLLSGFKEIKTKSYFGQNRAQKQALVKAFSWLNINLAPVSFRYSFGPKVASRLDYWSWKCGLTLDYNNGIYSYRPYLGFRHSLYSWLLPYDPLYGFYWSYRQIFDNPLIVDLSTDIADKLTEMDDFNMYDDLRRSVGDLSAGEVVYTDEDIKSFELPYRELYFTFHHPYFIGYLYFWLQVLFSNDFYLGFSNFSIKWLILKDFLVKNEISSLNFNIILINWTKTENRFWKNMFKYWIYYSNPSYLTHLTNLLIDDELNTYVDDMHFMHSYYLSNSVVFNFFNFYLNFSEHEIIFLLDYKKLYNPSMTNWLTLDMPFSINPYLVVNFFSKKFTNLNLIDLFSKQMFSFSHWMSLHENFNLNLLYDWSSGTYLDLINFVSYTSTSWGSTMLPNSIIENPTLIAATFVRYPWDKSQEIANEFWYIQSWFVNSDLLLGQDLFLSNLALIDFFLDSFSFIFALNSTFVLKNNNFYFIKFYFIGNFFNDLKKYQPSILKRIQIDSKISKFVGSYLYNFYNFIFLYWLQKQIDFESMQYLLATGLFFSRRNILEKFLKPFKIRMVGWYLKLYCFYKKFGLAINLFFKKD